METTMKTTMTPADVFNLLTETTQLKDADRLVPQGQTPNNIVYPIKLLEVGSLGPRRNPIHFFKNVGPNGFLIRFDYEPEIPANWDWRSITSKFRNHPNGYEINGHLRGSYHHSDVHGQELLKVYGFDGNLVDAVIKRYELLRTADALNGTNHHRLAGRYTDKAWPLRPCRIRCPWVAALIVRFHDQNPAYWAGPVGPTPAPRVRPSRQRTTHWLNDF